MASPQRQKLIIANAMNMVVEINQVIVENTRKKQMSEIVLPSLIDRAFMIVHETGVVPVVDTLSEE